MKTITKSEFLTKLEAMELEWPPLVIGSHVYSRENGRVVYRTREVYRAPL